MFCFNCGQDLGSGMAFCPRCGAKYVPNGAAAPSVSGSSVQPPAAKKAPSRKGLVAALVVAVIAVIALLCVVAVLLWGGDDDSRGSRENSTATEKEEKPDKEEADVSVEQILIAESVRTARQMGVMAGSMEYIEVMGTPDECVDYIRELAAFSDEPLVVNMNLHGSVPQEFVSAFYLTGENEGMLLASLPNVLNGRYVGNTALAAYSLMSTSHFVNLPEELDDPAVLLLGVEGSYACVYVTFIPAGGKLAQVSCTPISGGVFESIDLIDWLGVSALSDAKVEKAVEAARGVSLAAMPTFGRVDAEWCWTQANLSVRHLGMSRTPQAFEYFTDDEMIIDICLACADAAMPDWNFAPDASVAERMEACNAVVYVVDVKNLLLETDAARTVDQFWDILRPKAASAVVNSLIIPYGESYVAAGAVLNRAALMSDSEGAQPQRLPMGFDSDSIYLVYQELEGDFCAVTALYDAGNNILGVSTCILPDDAVFSDIIDSAPIQNVYRLD